MTVKISIRETVIFGMLSALMYASKMLMEALPNIHLLGVFVIALTVVYRGKALYPIYTFVLLIGLLNGFNGWWVPYLYIWTVLWGLTMLLPKNLPPKARPFIYMALCAVHGFAYGTLYAPAQAIMFGLDWQGMAAWIVAGLPWDAIHGVSNLISGLLICPLISILQKAEKYAKQH